SVLRPFAEPPQPAPQLDGQPLHLALRLEHLAAGEAVHLSQLVLLAHGSTPDHVDVVAPLPVSLAHAEGDPEGQMPQALGTHAGDVLPVRTGQDVVVLEGAGGPE